MLYEVEKGNNGFTVIKKYQQKSASELNVLEKDIENLCANEPKLLFPREEMLIFGQSIAGQRMADLLALDALGNLIIIEIKRDWSDRSTVAQLLEYAAIYKETSYEELNQIAKNYSKWKAGSLIDKFREFADRPEFPQEQLGKKQRVLIVAPDSDYGLKKVVHWLQSYGVPIEFVPFRLLSEEGGALRMIEIDGISTDMATESVSDSGWAGHWIFNTNETYAPGAYERMFERNVMAIYGYENGGANLTGANAGEKVFAYVNRHGLRALGEIRDSKVKPGSGVFVDKDGNQEPDEYHVAVDWKIILPKESAISNSQASSMGYSLPIRTVFGHLWRGQLATKLEEEMRRRHDSLPKPILPSSNAEEPPRRCVMDAFVQSLEEFDGLYRELAK